MKHGAVLGVMEEKGFVILNKWSRKPLWGKCHRIKDPEGMRGPVLRLPSEVKQQVRWPEPGVCMVCSGSSKEANLMERSEQGPESVVSSERQRGDRKSRQS